MVTERPEVRDLRAELIAAVEHTSAEAGPGVDVLVLAWQAYARWGLEHPGAYQLLFESDDQLAAGRADHPSRAENRFLSIGCSARSGPSRGS
jgi:hypothetical protein